MSEEFINIIEDNKFFQKINPSGYVESQASFTKRFSNEIKKRIDLKCDFKLNNQSEFSEPEIKINNYVNTLGKTKQL